jgi:hypothetical protein
MQFRLLERLRNQDEIFIECNRIASISASSRLTHDVLWWEQESAGKHSKKGALLYNYEDKTPETDVSAEFEQLRQRWVGRSRHRYDLLILPDPYNLLASKLITQAPFL